MASRDVEYLAILSNRSSLISFQSNDDVVPVPHHAVESSLATEVERSYDSQPEPGATKSECQRSSSNRVDFRILHLFYSILAVLDKIYTIKTL